MPTGASKMRTRASGIRPGAKAGKVDKIETRLRSIVIVLMSAYRRRGIGKRTGYRWRWRLCMGPRMRESRIG